MLQKLFCMRLNTAGVVIGWLGAVVSFIGIIMMSTILGYADVLAQRLVDENKMDMNKSYEEIHMAIIVVVSIYLAITVINLLSSGMLVLGTMKERHLMLLPWLINSGLGLFVSIVYNFAVLTFAIGSPMGANAIPAIIINGLILALQIYIYSAIYSLFKQIQLTREQQRPLISQPQAMAVPNQGNTYPSYTKI